MNQLRQPSPLRTLVRRAGCPEDHGEVIGTYEDFEVHCDSDMAGNDFDNNRADASNLTHCIDQCSGHKPRCFGVVYKGQDTGGVQNCIFKSGKGQLRRFDGAVAATVLGSAPPTATSDCGALEPTYSASNSGYEYEVQCNTDMSGNDIRLVSADSMAECIDQCSADEHCVGVTYNSARIQSFFTCFLKYAFDKERLVDTSNRDPEDGSQGDVAFRLDVVSPTVSSTVISTTTDGAITTGTGGEGDIGSSGSNRNNDDNNTTNGNGNDGGSGRSVGAIAGGIVGGVAVLGLIGLAFWLWKRRKHPTKHPLAMPTMATYGQYNEGQHDSWTKAPSHIPTEPVEMPPSSQYPQELPAHPYK